MAVLRDAVIQLRVSQRERESWRAAADSSEVKLSELVRAAMREFIRKAAQRPKGERANC